ncbi:MAG: small subunit ribosomal protein S6 [Rhodothermales bacterium]|jgi:small subunit ribosomal protein S6
MGLQKNAYELTYIVNSVLAEEQIKDLVERVTAYIKEGGSDVTDVDVWGSRRLSYPIQKKRNGFYVNMYFNAPGSFIGRLERALEIDDNILRYLTLKMDGKMTRHFEEQKKSRVAAEPTDG